MELQFIRYFGENPKAVNFIQDVVTNFILCFCAFLNLQGKRCGDGTATGRCNVPLWLAFGDANLTQILACRNVGKTPFGFCWRDMGTLYSQKIYKISGNFRNNGDAGRWTVV